MYRIIDGEFVDEVPRRKPGDALYSCVVGVLMNRRHAAEPVLPAGYSIAIQVFEGPRTSVITMPIEPFISVEDQRASFTAPLCFSELESDGWQIAPRSEQNAGHEAANETGTDVGTYPPPPAELDPKQARAWVLKHARAKARTEERARERERVRAEQQAKERAAYDALRQVWLFRDGIYVADAPPRPSELEELTLLIKATHYQRDDSLRRLREQVANFEAAESYLSRGTVRRPLADDVKLLVWTRDGGACVRCGARTGLHFDHIIPLAKGGSDSAENIQILCQACNLSKSDRIA